MLSQKHCAACEGEVDPFNKEKIDAYLPLVPEWKSDNITQVTRDFTFSNFSQALSFVNEVGEIAEEENHHPDIFLHNYKKVTITLSTHAIGGLSENDFILAAKIDSIKMMQ